MKGKGLGEARKLFRARKFPDVIRLLEPEVFRYRESFDYFWLLGFSCLHTGDLGGAFSYISRAHQLQHDDISSLLGMAAIHFRRAENEGAIKRWLEVLELQPANAVARRGLDLLRRGLQQDKLQEFIDAGRMRILYPPLPRRTSIATILVIVLGALIVAGLGVLGYRVTRATPVERPGVAGDRDSRRPVAPGGSGRDLPVHAQRKGRAAGLPEGPHAAARLSRQPRDGGDQSPPPVQRDPGHQGTGADAERIRHPADTSTRCGMVSPMRVCRCSPRCMTGAP